MAIIQRVAVLQNLKITRRIIPSRIIDMPISVGGVPTYSEVPQVLGLPKGENIRISS